MCSRLGGYRASLVPDSRISFPLDYGFRRFFNVVQKVILFLLAVKTQIFAILDNLVHHLRTQSNVVTLRAAKRMLVCTIIPGNLGILRIAETQLTAVMVGALTSSSWQWLWYSVLKYLLPSRSDLLSSSATSFFRPIWLSQIVAAMLSKPLSDFWQLSQILVCNLLAGWGATFATGHRYYFNSQKALSSWVYVPTRNKMIPLWSLISTPY